MQAIFSRKLLYSLALFQASAKIYSWPIVGAKSLRNSKQLWRDQRKDGLSPTHVGVAFDFLALHMAKQRNALAIDNYQFTIANFEPAPFEQALHGVAFSICDC